MMQQKPFATTRLATFFALGEDVEARAKANFMDSIQRLTARRVEPEDVHVRGMRIVNSQRDYYYSRFAVTALDEIARLLPGRPVIVGHRSETLPVGRFFAAERTLHAKKGTPKRDSHWVEALFYVPRDPEGDALVRRIDLGLYKEVSLRWRFRDAKCNLCDEQIMDERCGHMPGEIYENGICDYEMAGITSVLEGSLVFAGGQKGTHTFIPGGGDGDGRSTEGATIADLVGETARNHAASSVTDVAEIWAAKRALVAQGGERVRAAGECLRSSVVSVVAERWRFAEREDAAAWVRDHDFRADRAEDIEGAYAFHQRNQDEDVKLRRVNLDDGVRALVPQRKRQDQREADETPKLAEFFNQQ